MNRTKKTLCIILLIFMVISTLLSLPFTAIALDEYGACGKNVTYSFDDETGLLTISGNGDMYNYSIDYDDYISNSPFYGNEKIKNIVINYGVSSIGDCSFANCTNLLSVTIPESIIKIGHSSFEWCSSLEVVSIPKNTEITEDSFFACIGLKDIGVDNDNSKYSCVDGNLYNKEKTCLLIYAIGNDRVAFSVPSGVTRIEDNAFYRSTIENLTLPKSIVFIGDDAFYRAFNLKNVYYDGTMNEWKNIKIGHWNETLKDAVIQCNDGIFKYCDTEAHIWNNGEALVAPSCANNGKIIYTCSVCGDTKTEEIPATSEHTSDNGTITKKATPTTMGMKEYRCTVCGQIIKAETIEKCAKYLNTLTAKGKTVKVKKNKKTVIKEAKAFTINNAQGAVTFKKSKGNKKITVAKNGNITIKKGLKKGNYNVKIKVKAAGNSTYKATTKTVTVTIKVK